jgi:cytochrome b-561
MTLGLIFLYGDAILLYRVMRNVTKTYVKILHALVQVAAFIFSAIALKAVFDAHNKAAKPIPNLYSLHSWVGLGTVILFCMQWLCGFISFLFPKLSEGLRRMYLPHHKFWGIAIFVMACAAALMGITEKAIFVLNPKPGYATLPGEAILLNCFGMTIVIFATLVMYLVTKQEYKRPPETIN